MNFRLKLKAVAKRVLVRFPGLWVFALELRARVRRHRQLHDRWSSLSRSLERHGRLPQSLEASSRIRIAPAEADQHRRLRANLKLNAGFKEEALQDYSAILKAANYHPDKVIPIAHYLAVAGYLDEVVEIYTEARRRGRSSARRLTLAGSEIQVLPYYWVDRIGHLTFLECFIKMMIMGWIPVRTVILLAPKEKISNLTYLEYLSPYLIVESDPQTIASLEPLVNIIEDQYFAAYFAPSGRSCWWIRAAWAAQLTWDDQGRAPLLQLTNQHRHAGAETLKSFGIQSGDWYVCLHVRESSYHADKKDPSQTWRDSEIDRYDEAIKEIVARGGWVIRMGDAGMKPLRPADRVIDYALSDVKSDFMDVFLCATCRFFVATNSGLGIVPSTFGVPAVAVDYMPLANELYIKNGVFIPKLCWSSADSRYLTFDECMNSPMGYTHRGESFAGLTIRHNTPEEIRDVVVEMMDRAEGVAVYEDDDEVLQATFEKIRESHGVVGDARIGRAFLRRHAELLRRDCESPGDETRASLIASFGLPENTAINNLERGKLFSAIGSFEPALICLREARRLAPGNLESDVLLRKVHFDKARSLVFGGSYEH